MKASLLRCKKFPAAAAAPVRAGPTPYIALRAAPGRLVSFLWGGICAGLLVLSPHPAAAAPDDAAAVAADASQPRHADYAREKPSKEVRHIADWALDSGDAHGMPFAIVDKKAAKAYVFNPDGHLRGAAPVLLGIAKGDDSVPGIGDRELSDMPPEVRTTPAGRFVASLGRNANGKEILWVDYDAAISMHPVINPPGDHRLQRLASPTPLDNRISYGCINVPPKFFKDVVQPSFEGTDGIVYILPEVHPIQRVFDKAYDVGGPARTKTAGEQPAAPLLTTNMPSAGVPVPGAAVLSVVHPMAAHTSAAPSPTRTQ